MKIANTHTNQSIIEILLLEVRAIQTKKKYFVVVVAPCFYLFLTSVTNNVLHDLRQSTRLKCNVFSLILIVFLI